MPRLGQNNPIGPRLRSSPLSTLAGQARLSPIEAFGPNPGNLTLLAYRPQHLAPKAPLVVVLHGCTQTAEGYALGAGWIELAERLGMMVLAPEQSGSNNPNRCFNWFSPGDVRRGEGEVASIAAMIRHLVQDNDLDAERVFITGLSAGGAMAAAMLAAYPELFAAGAVIAGLPYGVARNVQDALRVMGHPDGRSASILGALASIDPDVRRPRLAIWHGDADHTVRDGNAHDLAQQWSAVHQLPSAPHQVEPQAFGTRSIWRSPDGEVLIEMNLVAGLGHGVPLKTKGPGGVGKTGPYMLEAGVSSSLEIARFWGFDNGVAGIDLEPQAPDQLPSTASTRVAANHTLGRSVMQAVAHVPSKAQNVIAKALRAAGLM